MKKEKIKYLIKYPYTVTISVIAALNLITFIYFIDTINYSRLFNTIAFTLLFGIAQIHGLENLGNVPAWFFPKGSSFFQDRGINFYKHIIIIQ